MSTTPEEPPTLEQQVAELQQRVTALEGALDGAQTANAVLQDRYGTLADQIAPLADRVTALESGTDA